VFKTDVPPVAPIAERAVVLAEQVDAIIAETTAADVHIIAHSMGGLDARYMISTLQFGDRIDSLTTISTPHRGTPLADSAAGVDVFSGLLGGGGADQASFDAAVADLSEANAAVFNAANLDVDGVFYQSFAGLSRFAGLAGEADTIDCAAENATTPEPDTLRAALVPTAGIVAGEDLRAHDGVVPVGSARWGTFRGCISADHIDELGQPGAVQSTFDAVEFYKQIVAELAAP
jgi:triacylglycerol lipase